MVRFYDTCSLLMDIENIMENNIFFYISSITLEELENIKTSNSKDLDTKFAARKTTHFLDEYNNYKTIIYTLEMEEILMATLNIPITNDTRIMTCARELDKKEDLVFITNDIAAKTIAKEIFKYKVDSVVPYDDGYTGIIEKEVTPDFLANFYLNLKEKYFPEVETNTYVIFKFGNNIVDKVRWTGTEYVPVRFFEFNSNMFGRVKPFNNDIPQTCLFDTLVHNKITLIRGKPGTGKSFISLAYLFNRLEKNEIDKIIIFCNPIATRDAAKLGFYPGDKDTKLLDSQIGNFLISKLGDKMIVDKLMAEGKLLLLPFSDLRGFDSSGMRAGIYITEAQNLTIDLMKLALQRIGQDCICIIDGDDKSQVDDLNYSGINNGIKRLSKVFRGKELFGEITLDKIHRSEIALIAEEM